MRILHILPTLDPRYGGPVEGAIQMARVSSEMGHCVSFVSFDSEVDQGRLNARVFAVGGKGGVVFNGLRLILFVYRYRNDFDAIVINGIWGLHFTAGYLGSLIAGIRFVVYTHGMLDPWFKRTYPLKHLKKWLFWPWGVYPGLRIANRVLFTCEEERRLARHSFWLYKCNERVVDYGTPGAPPDLDLATASAHARERWKEIGGRRIFLFLGRVHPKKGAELVFSAISELKREGVWADDKMCFVMAGPSDDKYGENLKKFQRENDLQNSIVWTGMVLGAQKWGLLAGADCFVLTSFQENFGIAVAEALSVRTPVLISNAVNIWDKIAECKGGLVGEPSVDSAKTLIRQWISLPDEERERYRENALRCFRENFTIAKAAVSLQKECEAAIASHR